MEKYILIITSSVDKTSDYLITNYPNNNYFRINTDLFDTYIFDINDINWCVFNKETNERVFSENIQSIYFRKPIFPEVLDYEEKYRELIKRDIYTVLCGLADEFKGKVLSRPYLLHKADNKVSQILVARKFGFDIPKSYIGNSDFKCKEFSNITSVIKPLSLAVVGKDKYCEVYQTNIFKYENEEISMTPIYLQEYVSKQFEVRLTIIKNNFFAIRIDTKNQIDWRKDYENHHYSIIECPEEIRKKCSKLLEYYNLEFGAFDFIVDKNNNWIFLEMNSNGQWLWLERRLNLQISKKIIDLLGGK